VKVGSRALAGIGRLLDDFRALATSSIAALLVHGTTSTESAAVEVKPGSCLILPRAIVSVTLVR